MLGSVLTVQRLEPASDSVSPSLSLPLPHSHAVSLSQKEINFKIFFKKQVFNQSITLNLTFIQQIFFNACCIAGDIQAWEHRCEQAWLTFKELRNQWEKKIHQQ